MKTLLLILITLSLSACVVAPIEPVYSQPVYVRPAPVVVYPSPYWYGHGHYRHYR